MNTIQRIVSDARALGIRRGDTVLVHSSMKSLGVADSPETVIRGLQEAVGASGNLLFPTLSFRSVNQTTPCFSVRDTRSCVGILPETFRHMPGVIRSVHPTHSVAAWGRDSAWLTCEHVHDRTPVGPRSPFRRMLLLQAKILMLGCGMGPNTFMHGVEEAASAPYLLLPEPWTYHVWDADGRMETVAHSRHGISRFGAQRYARAEALLAGDELLRGKICAADCHLIDAGALMRRGVEAIARDAFAFIERK